jgi:hypothetical protein
MRLSSRTARKESGNSMVKIKLCSIKTTNNYVNLFVFKAYKDDSLFEPNVSIEDLQKKIIPWHSLIPRQEDIESVSRKTSATGGLIIVSSLIDKVTNLGRKTLFLLDRIKLIKSFCCFC